jgi:cytochrome c553
MQRPARSTKRSAQAAALVLLAWPAMLASTAQADDPETFAQAVQPIFRAKCQRCHGAETQKSDLNLSTPAGIRQGGESGPILDVENLKESTLYEYVRERIMPPEGEGELSDEEIAVICRWIEAGAKLGDANPGAEKQLTQHDVLPTLLLRCSICHARQRSEAELDVRSVAALLKGGKSGPAIVPGKPDESLIVQKIRAEEMPPRKTLAFYSVKPVTDFELETLTRWIAAGAPVVDVAPDVAGTEPDPLVTDEERRFWAFQPPRAAPVPHVADCERVQNPVDAFLLEKLQKGGLSLSPEADRRALARRVYFDLLGLPPEVAEVEAFLADARSDAYERMVDRALASPHYGERWGQYWLDLAGYADSEGIQNADDVRPHAWRYRDYVIRAFNDDKPYDRFLVEQLAGDELADYENAAEITPEIYDNLVATAFLRLAPDATYSPITGFVPDRLEVIDDEIEVLSSAVFGLTIKCARCHSHKFDPIPQRDYYRLAAALKGALDEHDWLATRLGGPDQPTDALTSLLPFVTSAERAAWQAAGGKPADEPKIRAVWDRGEPSPTYVLRRGNYLTPATLVGPGVPSVLTDGRTPFVVEPPTPGSAKTGRRLALARWATGKDHPLTARVMVNRVWKHHFGEGIVRSLDNFGKVGAPPTHPELLDWLAVYFVEHRWSVKQLHRLMMNSAAYRQSSQVTAEHERLDPDNALLSRMPLKRMEGEVLRDSLLAVSGRLDATPYGRPDAISANGDGLVTAQAAGHQKWRRSIYVLKRRTQPLTILQNFDVAGMDPNCIERSESIVAPQALHLKNNLQVRQLAKSLAARIWNESEDDPQRQVQAAYRIIAAREPTPQETQIARAALGELESQWARHKTATRHELAAAAELWIRESEPDTVYENDLISVWSSAGDDEGRRVGLVEFDVSEFADLELTDVRLELGLLGQAAHGQSAAVVPPGIGGITWNRYVQEKQPHVRPLAQLGRVKLPAGDEVALGAYVESPPATADDLGLVRAAADSGGKLALVLAADEDGTAYRQDWDDGQHSSTRQKPPRLVVYHNPPDQKLLRRWALENLCHALFNSAAFLYID